MDLTNKELVRIGEIESERILRVIKQELLNQGHNLNGILIRSLKYSVNFTGDVIIYDFDAAFYWEMLNDGAPPGFKVSRPLINKLRQSYTSRGLNSQEALVAAFRTARALHNIGMPTKKVKSKSGESKGANFFSKVGRRKGFLNVVIGKEENEIARRLNNSIERYINKKFDESLST